MQKRAIQTILAVLLAVALLGDPTWAKGGAKKKESGGGHGGAAAVVEVPRFIELDILVAPIISSRRVRGQMELSLVIEVKNEKLGSEVMRKLPRLEASFVSVATNYAASLGLPTKRLNLTFVMNGMQAEADRIFPPGTVAILIQQALYRR